MATTTKPYDPINRIEGMFNGCITRIAQAIKDPANFGPSTKGILFECSKQFQDALDDCTIQVLDAKFYLEHQLALNKARREAKAKEESAATAKRKHDQIKDTEETEETSKRVKLDDTKPTEPAKPVKQDEPANLPRPTKPDVKSEEKPQDTTPKPTTPSKPQPQPAKAPDKPKTPEKPAEEPASQPIDDFPRATPNATPAPTNDDFNFESMFGEPSGEAGVGEGENDMPFDLDLGGDFGSGLDANDSTQQNSDLNPLLPGLESYANQAPDDPGAQGNVQANPFDLPDLPNLGPNDFDAFLDANDFTAGGGDMNLNGTDDPMANLDNLDSIDLDSFF